MFDTRRIKTLFGVLLVASLLVNSFAYAEKPDSQSMRPTSGWKDTKQMVSAENCTCTTVRASDKSEEHDGTSVSEKTVAKRYLSEKDRSSIVRKLEEIKPYQNLGFLEVVLARVKKLEGNISNSSMVSWRKVIQLGRLAEMRELIEARITELSGSGSTNLPDVKAPVVSALSVTGITSTTATFSVKTSESGTGYYVLLASGATAPSALQVKAGQDGMGVTAAFKGSLVTIVGTSAFTVTWLTSETTYSLYYTAEDSAGNLRTPAKTLTIVTLVTPVIPDVTAPVISEFSATGVTATGATFSVKTSESGTGYYVLLASGATAPSALQVKAGQDGMGVTSTIKWTLSTAASVATPFSLTGLASGTPYVLYFTAEDGLGNLQSVVSSISITTLTP